MYRGVHLRVQNGGFYQIKRFVNGVSFGNTYGHMGEDDQKALDNLKGIVDHAIANPDRYEPHWQPGYKARAKAKRAK
jgi:hypothetical protein